MMIALTSRARKGGEERGKVKGEYRKNLRGEGGEC